jgi:hypothetical protein
MSRVCCPRCRLRFDAAASAYLVACPQCGDTPRPLRPQLTFGFRLYGLEDLPDDLPQAMAVEIPVPDPPRSIVSGPKEPSRG